MKNKTIINLVSSVLVLVVNVLINFWMSPFIVENIGVEANGFVTLANNFVLYANLIVISLNSMAARFITIEYTKKNYEKANLYYNSVFWGNLIICAVLFIPTVFLLTYFEYLFDVPSDILIDVKLLFALVFLGFFLTTAAPNWNVGCFAKNRLDRDYIPQSIITVMKSMIIYASMVIFTPNIWYVGFAALFYNVAKLSVNAVNTHVLTPELRIVFYNKKPLYSLDSIKELVGAGVWNSVSQVGNMLITGLDLIVCNKLFGATAMGIVSVSKMLPTLLSQLSGSFTNAFAPELTINYATGKKDMLIRDINRAMKLTGMLMTIVAGGIIAFGKSFFSLWVPNQDGNLLGILSFLAILSYIFSAGIQILYNVFPTTNHVKESAIAQIITGVVSILVTVFLAKFTSLGIYAVAGVSSICNIIRNLVYTIPVATGYLGLKKYIFYPMVLRSVISTALVIGISYLIMYFVPVTGWSTLVVDAFVVTFMGVVFNVFVMLNRDDREYLFNKFRNKFC